MNEDKIRMTAYYIWQAEGCPAGREHDHWMKAMKVCGGTSKAKEAPKRMAKEKEAVKPAVKKTAVRKTAAKRK